MSKYLNYFFYNIKKKLSIGTRPLSGRNFLGKICVHHRSGGNKKKYCYIDFFRRINNYGYIYKIIKSSNRTAFIGGIIYENGLFSYIIISETVKIGTKIYSGTIIKYKSNTNIIGNSIIMKEIKLFSIVNNIEKYPFSGGSLIRSAGTSAIITTKINNQVMLKLKSG
jgi:large subunit ribosomal protein L2